MDIRRFLKSVICVFTAIVIFNFGVIQASAEITPEQELLNWVVGNGFEQGIPYLPSWFSDCNGWTNIKSKWEDFVSSSIYANHLYVTYVYGESYNFRKDLWIYNYDNMIAVSNGSFTFDNYVVCSLAASYNSSYGYYTVIFSTPSYSNIVTNFSGSPSIYVSISLSGQTVLLDDSTLLQETIDEDKKSTGILDALKNLLTGKLSLFNVDASLVDKFSLLGDSFNGWLSDLLDVDVDVSSDEYNTLLNDLEYNTQNSAYINNVSQDTLNQIRNTYNNMKSCVDNSVSVYNDDDDKYYYTSNSSNATYSTTTNSSTPNYVMYEGDTSEYFTTYMIDTTYSSSDDGSGNGSSSSSGGCGCTVNATANAEVNQGDININVGDTSSSDGGSDVTGDVGNLSAFETMIDQCTSYWQMVVNLVNMLPSEISLSFAGLISVVVICRVLGR